MVKQEEEEENKCLRFEEIMSRDEHEIMDRQGRKEKKKGCP